MMIDTDIFIWYFRGSTKAKMFLDKQSILKTSAVVYMELLQGIRNSKELRILKQFIIERHVEVINFDHEITGRAIYFLERFRLSNSLSMADALIAATADLHGSILATGNYKHYRIIPGLEIKRFSPGR